MSFDALGYKYYFEYTVTGYGSALEPGLPEKERSGGYVSSSVRAPRPGGRGLAVRPGASYFLHHSRVAVRAFRCAVLCAARSHPAVCFQLCGPISGHSSVHRPVGGNAECACWRKGLQTLRESMGCRCTPVPRLWSFPNTASGTRRASTARKWSVSQGIQSGWKGVPGQRPACGCAASVDVGVYNTCPNELRLLLCHHTPGAAAARPRRPCTGRADAHRMAAGRRTDHRPHGPFAACGTDVVV